MVNAILKPKSGRFEDISMMRIASVFLKFTRPVACGALLLLAGCAGGQVADVQDAVAAEDVAAVQSAAAVDSFTTVGKPTKTIETPWGPREVYDPTQDPQVKAIFNTWYLENNKTYDRYRYENSSEVQLVELAARVHELDYLKNKCEMRERVFFGAEESPYYKKKYTGSCDVETGNAHLSSCVQENLVDRDLGRPDWMVKRKIKYNPNWGVPEDQKIKIGMLENGFIIGEKSYPSVAQQMDVFFSISCRKWVGISDLSKGYELYYLNTKKSDFSTAFRLIEPDLKEHCKLNKEEIKICQDF